MKKLTLFAAILFALFVTIPVTAQTTSDGPSWRDEEFSLELTYARRGVELLNRELRPVPVKDHLGANFGYTHYFGRKNGRGNLGMGFDMGFARRLGEGNKNTKTIGRGQYKLVYMNNAPDKSVRPGVKLTVGWFRDDFRELVCRPNATGLNCGGVETSETFGGGVFTDFGKGRRRVRVGVEYFTTSFNEQWQHNAEARVGFVF